LHDSYILTRTAGGSLKKHFFEGGEGGYPFFAGIWRIKEEVIFASAEAAGACKATDWTETIRVAVLMVFWRIDGFCMAVALPLFGIVRRGRVNVRKATGGKAFNDQIAAFEVPGQVGVCAIPPMAAMRLRPWMGHTAQKKDRL
jgi:hypothetical protein